MERLTYVDARGRVLFTPSEEVDENPDIGYDIRQIAEYGYREYLSLIAERLANREQYCEMLKDELKTYKDAEEQGLLLRLHCKVGDTVFHKDKYSTWLTEIQTYQITNIMISQNKKGIWTKKYRAMMFLNGKIIDVQLNFSFDDLGKTVFLTKEEAEAALEKMKKKEHEQK